MVEQNSPAGKLDTSVAGGDQALSPAATDASGQSKESSGEPRVWSDKEVQDLLADRGRADAAMAAREARISAEEKRLDEVRQKRQQEELNAVKGNPDAYAAVQYKIKLETKEAELVAKEKRMEERLARADAAEFAEMVSGVAAKNKIDAVVLTAEAKKLKAQGFEGEQLRLVIESFAKVMTPAGKAPPNVPPTDSQRRNAPTTPDSKKMTGAQLIAAGLAAKAKK